MAAAHGNDLDYIFKIILVGDSGVGKSSLILRYADEVFQDSYICTIGVDLRIRTIKVEDKVAKLHIWDTAGQERFKTLCTHYYRGADAIVLVFDVTNQDSFTRTQTWYQDIKANCRGDCHFILIGNKNDLQPQRAVTTEQAKVLADALNMQYMETSAKESTNVSEMFTQVANELVAKHRHRLLPDSTHVLDPAVSGKSTPVRGKGLMSLNCFDCTIC